MYWLLLYDSAVPTRNSNNHPAQYLLHSSCNGKGTSSSSRYPPTASITALVQHSSPIQAVGRENRPARPMQVKRFMATEWTARARRERCRRCPSRRILRVSNALLHSTTSSLGGVVSTRVQGFASPKLCAALAHTHHSIARGAFQLYMLSPYITHDR